MSKLKIIRRAALSVIALSASIAPFARANASDGGDLLTLTIIQSGSNVVFSSSGNFNTAALTTGAVNTLGGVTNSTNELIVVGTSANVIYYIAPGLNTAFSSIFASPVGRVVASNSSGAVFGFSAKPSSQDVYVPQLYVNGSTITDSSTYSNTTIAALGLNAGTYTYNYGAGDQIVVNIQATAVPEPVSMVLLGTGIIGLMAVRRRSQG